jgi:hypothetical protein
MTHANDISVKANVSVANVKGAQAPGRSQNVVAKTKAVL